MAEEENKKEGESTEKALESEEEKKEEIHEEEDDSSEEEEEKAEEEVKPVAEIDEEKTSEEPKSDEDEFVTMMKAEEKEKKAEAEAKSLDLTAIIPDKEEEVEEISLVKKKPKKKKKEEEFEEVFEESKDPKIYALRTTANREDQVMSFLTSNASRKKLDVYSVIRPHGMRGYIFIEAGSRSDAEQAAFGVPYARGLLDSIIQYQEIEHMLEQVKKEANIQKNDIAEIISGPFKREKAKITRIDRAKEEVVVELLEAAVPIPLTLKIDAVRVIRREGEDGGKLEE
jgi:transcriptional antiterminator NusG